MSDKVWTLPLPEKYPPLGYYIERVRTLERQLAEARALIRAYSRAQNIGDLYAAEQEHAAALKEAREGKS